LSIDDQLASRIRRSWIYRAMSSHDRVFPPASPANPRLSFRVDDGPISEEAARRNPELAAAVRAIEWYHTIDLGDGLVPPGAFDHRPFMQHYAIPQRLDGLRVLDVATFDGYWAFEFERRGAAEVVALDIEKLGDADLPPAVRFRLPVDELERNTGLGFALARAARLQGKTARAEHLRSVAAAARNF
jgi:hypothetical protein